MPNIKRGMMGAAGVSGGSGAVNFDGTTWLSRGADLSGISATIYWTFSFWYKFDSETDTTVYENRSENVKFLNRAVWQTECKNPDTVNDAYEGLDTDLTNWHHTCGTITTASAANTNYFRDDALITPGYQFGSRDGSNIDLSSTDHFLFSRGGPTRGGYFEGSIYGFWMDWGQNFDVSVAANRAKFINTDLTPVDLGSDGSTPTGTAPTIYMTGGADDFATNNGTGGAFTVGAGALIETGAPTVANQP